MLENSRFNPAPGIRDFWNEFRKPHPYRLPILLVSFVPVLVIFYWLAGETVYKTPERPRITYITTFDPNRTDEEIIASNIENQKVKELREERDAERAQQKRDLYKALGAVSGMDVDEIERRGNEERAAQEAAEKARLDELFGRTGEDADAATASEPDCNRRCRRRRAISDRATTDTDWMAATARLADRARPRSRPNPPVAAIIVRDERVIGRGWTQHGGRPHAEAIALEGMTPGSARGAVLYVTLEPCAHESDRGPACTDLVIAARPDRVVIGQSDPDPRTAGMGAKRIRREGIAVDILDDDHSARSLSGYLTRARFGRPRVTLKLAMSLDGCIALADGSSKWITGAEARAHVHVHRARHDAILVGGATWRGDRPALNVRLDGLENRSPERFLLTRGIQPDGVRVINRPAQIADIAGVQYLYVEGGAVTAASFLAEDLVDEIHLYRAPVVIGDGQHSIGGLGLDDLAKAHGRWHLHDRRQLGSDEFTAYRRTRAE